MFCENVFVSGNSPVDVQPKMFDILLRKLHIVYMLWEAGFSLCGECNMD
jgi:hypothetical protein